MPCIQRSPIELGAERDVVMSARCSRQNLLSTMIVLLLGEVHIYPRSFASKLCYLNCLIALGLHYSALCRDCFHMLHYGSDNQLLYDDFLVFPYFHDNV